ncbi:MAG: diacylglycerol kinase family protein [Patescibacteria group bacterium]|jgi:diacylglycerol kinase family enzyme
MYLYLYDSFLNDKKYSGLLAKIETRLTDLGIGGKIFRLSPLRNVSELLSDEIRGGAKTIVVVGNDKTFSQIVNIAAPLNITLGLIPVGPDNKIAKILGLPEGEAACNVIAGRIVEKVDLGKANNTYFLSGISVSGGQVTIECENKFQVTPQTKDAVNICNLRPLFATQLGGTNCFNPQDGFLEILIQPLAAGFWQSFKKSVSFKDSVIPFKKIAIRSKDSLPVITDGQRVLKTPVQIEIVPQKLNLIVGKNRLF